MSIGLSGLVVKQALNVKNKPVYLGQQLMPQQGTQKNFFQTNSTFTLALIFLHYEAHGTVSLLCKRVVGGIEKKSFAIDTHSFDRVHHTPLYKRLFYCEGMLP